MQKIAVVSLVVFGSLFWCYDPTSAAPEKKGDMIMDEILEVMRQYQLNNGDDTDTVTETTPPLNEDAIEMVSDLNTCPAIELTSPTHGATTIATCTEVTYECINKSHVLVVGGDGVCLNVDKTTRDCSSNGWDPNEEPFCSPVCTVEEKVGRRWTIQMPGSRLIGSNQVLPNSTVVFSCDGTATLRGKEKLVCLEDGRFDAEFPECEGNNVTVPECGDGEWIRLFYMNMSDPDANMCPNSWTKASSNDGSITGCHGQVGGECSPFYIEVGSEPFRNVCGMAVGYQMGFPDAYSVNTLPHSADSLYVDGLSITYGFPRYHIWTYAVASSRSTIYRTDLPTCPCQHGQPAPLFVGNNYYCDSGHGTLSNPSNANIQENGYTVYSKIKNDTSLWEDSCACCKDYEDKDVTKNPPWFVRHNLDLSAERTTHFDIRLCEHEVDMQEGALITGFALYVQ